MLHDVLSFVIKTSLPSTANAGDVVYVTGNTEDETGLFVFSGTAWKNIMASSSGLKTKNYTQTYTNMSNVFFVNASEFIGNDICIRLLLEINNSTNVQSATVLVKNMSDEVIQTISISAGATETYNLTSITAVKIYVSTTDSTLTLTMN